jgi:hypothetical protein
MPIPIAYLEVIVKFSKPGVELSNVALLQLFQAMRILLNPFRRLCNVVRPRVSSVTVGNPPGREINILSPGWMIPSARQYYNRYLMLWSKDLASSQALLKVIYILESYWRITNLVSSIVDHCNSEPKFARFATLRDTARFAREQGDAHGLREVWNQVAGLWFEYLKDQETFQSGMTRAFFISPVA